MDIKVKRIGGWMDRHAKFFFTLPALLVIFGLMVFPIVYNVYISFFQWSMGGKGPFIGLSNYSKLFWGDPRFINSIWVTFKFVVPSVILCVGMGMVIALLLNREFKGKGWVRTIFLLPMLATPAAIAVVWMIMYNPTLGVMNYFLSLFGLNPQLWVNSTTGAIPSLIVIEVWKWVPLPMMIILAALQSMPASPFEAAKIDGATPWQTFRYITFPLIQPAVMVAVILRTIDCLKTFDIIYVMTQGGPDIATETLEIYTYKTGFTYFQLGYSSAMAIVLTILIMVISWLLSKARGKSWSE
jgi:multiple sugar transport system permease protein